jgi:hypothetical protein
MSLWSNLMIKIKATVRDVSGEWEEFYTFPELNTAEDAAQKMGDILAEFNKTRRPGEHLRSLVWVVEVDEGPIKHHRWHHVTPLSIVNGPSIQDKYECTECGATGKRYARIGAIVHDAGSPQFCK